MKSSGPSKVHPSRAGRAGACPVAVGQLPQASRSGRSPPGGCGVPPWAGHGGRASPDGRPCPPRSLAAMSRYTYGRLRSCRRPARAAWPGCSARPARRSCAPRRRSEPRRARSISAAGRASDHRLVHETTAGATNRRGRPLRGVRPAGARSATRPWVRRGRCGSASTCRSSRPTSSTRGCCWRTSPTRRMWWRRWATILTIGGRVLVDDLETIETTKAFRSYLDDVALAVVRAQGGALFVGPAAARGRRSRRPGPRVHDEVVAVRTGGSRRRRGCSR